MGALKDSFFPNTHAEGGRWSSGAFPVSEPVVSHPQLHPRKQSVRGGGGNVGRLLDRGGPDRRESARILGDEEEGH